MELNRKFPAGLKGVRELVFDFAAVPDIASAGLRVTVRARQLMAGQAQ